MAWVLQGKCGYCRVWEYDEHLHCILSFDVGLRCIESVDISLGCIVRAKESLVGKMCVDAPESMIGTKLSVVGMMHAVSYMVVDKD